MVMDIFIMISMKTLILNYVAYLNNNRSGKGKILSTYIFLIASDLNND